MARGKECPTIKETADICKRFFSSSPRTRHLPATLTGGFHREVRREGPMEFPKHLRFTKLYLHNARQQ
jgi:hypothetical protein